MTGLTKDGQAVASSRYHLYGARKTSTDTTGNPFAYNGEARDDTGLDYLRARYYDSQGGTFLTEDSYPGEDTDPLSQNRYSYVQNNPVNYTDPSGHFWNSIKKGWNYVKSGLNWAGRQISRGVNWVGRQISRGVNWVGRQIDRGVNWVGRQIDRGINWVGRQIDRGVNWVGRQWNKVQTTYNSTVDYVQTKYQQAQARIQELHYQAIRTAYAVAIGFKASPTIREGKNLLRNWGTALQNTLKHVCTTAERIKNQVVDFVRNVDWKKVAVTAGAIGVGIALTVATGGLGAPVAMAIGGAASGAIISGYDAYSSGQRGWELVGSIAKGAGTGAISGLIGGQLMGAGAGLATNVTQNIGNQAVRQVAKIGVESAVETAIDTGIDLATGNKITGQTVAMNFAFNTFTNGAGSVSPKKAPKADVVTTKPKSGDVPITRPRKDVTPVQQLALPGPTSKPLALPAPSDKISQINPYNIRFSQSSVNGADSIQSSMISNGWKGDAIDVVNMPDGKLTTIDNTRVIAARGAGIAATARVHQYTDPLPEQFIDRLTTPAGTPSTWGEAVQLRVGKQKSSFRTLNPYGSYDLERRN